MMKADRLMAEAITTVVALYEDGIIEKPVHSEKNAIKKRLIGMNRTGVKGREEK